MSKYPQKQNEKLQLRQLLYLIKKKQNINAFTYPYTHNKVHTNKSQNPHN